MMTYRPLAIPIALCAFLAAAASAGAAGTPDTALRSKIFSAFSAVKSYKLTVLGSVRSVGVWVAPDRYHMTTEIEGKPLETIIVGNTYYTKSGKTWEKSGTTSSNLDVDIAGLIRHAKSDPNAAFMRLPQATFNGKKMGAFVYTLSDGTEDTCNYDLVTYRVTRCKAEDVTMLYSGFNDPKNAVPKIKL